jgi:hypothetical protein
LTLFASPSTASTRAIPSRTAFPVPPFFLNRVRRDLARVLQFADRRDAIDLVRLAAKADELHREEIRMMRVAGERSPQDLDAFAFGIHAAARLVRQRDDAIDIRIRIEPVLEMPRDHAAPTVAEQLTLVRMPM